ncbi:tRNA-binding protein [Weissella uvarum]|uniref:YtpR family tRNA-binding protein n=1 Tax=Weissella uvarum TaxID=1479233 RepID=UPI0019601E8B|nr:DUF4479 and tRNA-binding domain-containing protein [Weissella uvarum]MBM7617511.1 tRNA-binding protein [Weissella uvarum]MCM0595605.1 DUF4479 and tRNA-binding domain-containing protein [Weissella uvarum]
MLISSYNPAGMQDVLVVITGPQSGANQYEQNGDVVHIMNADNETIGYNILNASQYVDLTGVNGPVVLSAEQVDQLNQVIAKAGFATALAIDLDPKFVVGYVETAEPHPDSDHLQVTQTKIDGGNTLQIVSGSPNMQAGIKVVVAKVGAMMPSGLIIWPGALRGVESDGMIVSGRELGLPNAPQQPGALILPDDFAEVGTPFDAQAPAAQNLFK